MAHQACKIVSTHPHKISGCKIISRLVHSRSPHLWGMNDDVQSNIAILGFKIGEHLEDFNSRIIRLQQEINLSGETVYPTRRLFQYMKALSKSDELKAFIVRNMKYLVTFLDNNGKYAVYKWVNIRGSYSYLEIIGDPTSLTTSVHHSRHLGPSSSINNYKKSLQTDIADICMRQKSICKWCGSIVHKTDACIICVPKFPPPSIR